MSVFYINEDIILENKDNNIIKHKEFEFSKEDIITSSLSIKDVVSYTLKLPKSNDLEELKAEAEIQFYENAGLNLEKEYVTQFLFKEIEQENIYLIEALGIAKDKLTDKFKNIIAHTKYMDFISLSTLSFSAFYELYNKTPQRDAFVYLDNNQSFIAVYENGEYLYSKTLHNLSTLLKNISLSYEEFIEVISTKGVDKEKYEMDDLLISTEIDKFFSDYFMAINNRLGYGKSIFYLDSIENIYFYTPFKIEGLDKLKNFWDLSGINFEVIEPEEINFLDKLACVYNTNNYESEINFSIFDRPPKFYKTRLFQLIMVVSLTFLIFGGDFLYRYYQNKQLDNNIQSLNKKLSLKQKKLKKLKIINKIILEKLANYEKEIKDINKRFSVIKAILEKSLYLVNIKKINEDLITISRLLDKNKLKTFVIAKDIHDNFIIGVYTEFQNRKFISIFMQDLFNNHYKNVQTDKISTIDGSYYMSIIRFSK